MFLPSRAKVIHYVYLTCANRLTGILFYSLLIWEPVWRISLSVTHRNCLQIFYDVSWPLRHSFDYFFNVSILQVGFETASWVFVLYCTVSDFNGGRDTSD